jgi:hypothetical protein
MKIFVGQIYVIPGVVFPFSIKFQIWLGNSLTNRVRPSEHFCNKYSADFDIGFRISAKNDIDQPEIKGPTVFRRDNDVEFTIFLPYTSVIDYYDPQNILLVFKEMLRSIIHVLDAAAVHVDSTVLEAEFLNTPGLLKMPHLDMPR